MNIEKQTLFGMPSAVVAAFGVSLIVTVVVALSQLYLRDDVRVALSLRIFYYLYLVVDYPAAVIAIGLLFASLTPALQRSALALLRQVDVHPSGTIAIAWILLAAGAYFVYRAYPLCMDEYAPYFQSRAFLAGHLAGKFPPALIDRLVAPGFQEMFLFVSHESGEVASGYWPGFAIILTPFMALGMPWLANPTIGALSLLVIYRLSLELLGSRTAAASAMLLAIASPAFSVNAISFYSMPAHLLCNAAFALLLLKPTPARALAAGLVGGLGLILHNPVPHLLFALPWLVWLLTRPGRWQLMGSILVGYLPGIAVGFGWHYYLQYLSADVGRVGANYGGPFSAVIESLRKVLAAPGRAMMIVRGIGASKLWLWAVPSMLVFAVYGFWRHRRNTFFMLLAASASLTFAGYLFVPVDQGHGWGFRYFHSAWFVLPIFAAAALPISKSGNSSSTEMRTPSLMGYLHAAALGSMTLLTGYYAYEVHAFISRHLNQVPQVASGSPRVIFLDPSWGYYAFDLVQNDPFLRDGRTILLTQGNASDAIVISRHFPGLVKLGGDYRGSVWGVPGSDSDGGGP